jgi:hypothetical protein
VGAAVAAAGRRDGAMEREAGRSFGGSSAYVDYK